MLSLNNKPAPTNAAVLTSPQLGDSQLAGQPPTALAGPLRTGAITPDLWPLGPDEGSMEQTQGAN